MPRRFFWAGRGEPYFDLLWATTEVERLSKLVTYAPDLMTYDDTRLWEVVLSLKDNTHVWGVLILNPEDGSLPEVERSFYRKQTELADGWVVHGLYSWEDHKAKTLNAALLREIWGDIKALSEDAISMRDLERKIKEFDPE